MSKESMTDLNQNVLVGYTAKRGNAWHYRADEQGAESNHYEGAIPVEDVERRLFDWTAEEAPVEFTTTTGEKITDESRKVIYRSDTAAPLGIFKNGYKGHDYKDTLLRHAEQIVDADLAVGSAGLLVGGARAWVQVEMADTLSIEGFEHRPFLTLATSFDGSLATTFLTGSQAVVCDNTLSAALSTSVDRYKVKHSAYSLGKVQDAREALHIVWHAGQAFEEQARELMQIKVSDREFHKFLDAYLELTDDKVEKGGAALTIARGKQDDLLNLWNHDDRVSPWKGSAFGVVQAVNTFDQHISNVRGATRVERNMGQMITGGFDKLDQSTFSQLQTVLA